MVLVVTTYCTFLLYFKVNLNFRRGAEGSIGSISFLNNITNSRMEQAQRGDQNDQIYGLDRKNAWLDLVAIFRPFRPSRQI